MVQMMKLEREVKSGAYTCEIYSHGNVYGFCTYTEDGDIKQLAYWDFGFDSVETAECFGLAGILRCMYDVVEKDYNISHDAKCDSDYCPC